MENKSEVHGNQNIVIQGITNSTIQLTVGGEAKEIRNDLAEMKALLAELRPEGLPPFNVQLTRRFMEAMAKSSKPAQLFLEKARQYDKPNAPWETHANIRRSAGKIILFSYLGVIVKQLQKLLAIGLDDGNRDSPDQQASAYLKHSFLTAQRLLQVLSFSLLSALWDVKKQQENKPALSEALAKSITRFFDNIYEHKLTEDWELIALLLELFATDDLAKHHPLPEAKALHQDPAFADAVQQLQDLRDKIENQKTSPRLACYVAESLLATLLERMVFFANYKMLSMKSVVYLEIRNDDPAYLHGFAALETAQGSTTNHEEKVHFDTKPINTDAILLYKGDRDRYHNSINLFPFVIDLNAISGDAGVSVCFFEKRDELDAKVLNFYATERGGIEEVRPSGKAYKKEEMDEVMSDPEAYKTYKQDMIVKQFEAVRKDLLSGTPSTMEDDFGDIGQFFEEGGPDA